MQFEAAAKINNWATAEKATALVVSLRGDAMDILQTVPAHEQSNYHEMIKRLEMRYGHAHLEEVYHAKLKNRCQKTNEGLQEFEADVARLVRLAFPTAPDNFLECLAVRTFIDGLRDTEAQHSLRMARPKTLTDALSRALEYEAAKQASRSHARVRTVQDEQQNPPNESMEDVCRRILNEVMKKKKEPRCWNCGELGHLRNRCNNRRRSFPNNNTNQQQEN